MTERNKVPECEFDKIGKRDKVNAIGRKRERVTIERISLFESDGQIYKQRER